jgi:hypothetical protein
LCRYSLQQLERIRESYEKFTPYIRMLIGALTVLTVIWELMLLVTALYFNNFPQKVFGGMFGIVGWFMTYRVWYAAPPLDSWSPGLPGRGVVRYQ